MKILTPIIMILVVMAVLMTFGSALAQSQEYPGPDPTETAVSPYPGPDATPTAEPVVTAVPAITPTPGADPTTITITSMSVVSNTTRNLDTLFIILVAVLLVDLFLFILKKRK